MKTFEQWDDYLKHGNRNIDNVFWKNFIQQIQLDAAKWGAEQAARITSRYLETNRLHPDIPNEHLADAARIASHSALQQAACAIGDFARTLTPEQLPK